MTVVTSNKRKLLYATLILAAIPAIAACNTVKGAGKDVQKAGEVVEEGADEVGEEMGE